MVPALTIPQWTLLSVLCALNIGIAGVHVVHGWNCWGFYSGAFTNHRLVDGLVLLLCAAALYCLVTATSVRGFCARLSVVAAFLGASAFFYHQGARALYISFHHQPLGRIHLFLASLNLGIAVLSLLGGRAKWRLPNRAAPPSPGAPSAERQPPRERRKSTAMLRVLVVAAIVSCVVSAGATLLEGVSEVNNKIGQTIAKHLEEGVLLDLRTAQELHSVWSVFQRESWIRAFWLERFPGVWLYTFASCVLVGLFVTRADRRDTLVHGVAAGSGEASPRR